MMHDPEDGRRPCDESADADEPILRWEDDGGFVPRLPPDMEAWRDVVTSASTRAAWGAQ